MPTSHMDFPSCHAALVESAGPSARRAFDAWRQRPDLAPVHSFVMNFSHSHLYRVGVSDLTIVAERTKHALGDVRRHENLDRVRDFATPFAFQYLFHLYLETHQAVPTWEEMRDWLVGPAAPYYIDPFVRHFGLDLHDQEKDAYSRSHWRALRWRLGNMYYSALRELHLMASLRELHGIDVAYHIFADVVLRCDFWTGRTLISLYIGNQRFRDGDDGRKLHVRELFGDAPAFSVVEANLEPADQFGVVKFVSDRDIADLAHRIRSSEAQRAW